MNYDQPINNYTLAVIDANHPLRAHVESYIYSRYSIAFNAHIHEFMPMFVAILDENNAILSACGYREADSAPLFLEQYLHAPADQLMSDTFEQPISRNKLIEFGQLASFSKGMSPLHFMLMAEHLVNAGYEWCIFTATDPLHAMMTRLRLHPVILTPANADYVQDGEEVWGNYYHHNPKVSAGNLKQGLAQLTSRFTSRNRSLSQPQSNFNSLSQSQSQSQKACS